ncbi:putative cytochrome P450 [Xylogone sp. PMI_703]|nr:putative cytochrome P450 [Xylogone sp. PMI_703]
MDFLFLSPIRINVFLVASALAVVVLTLWRLFNPREGINVPSVGLDIKGSEKKIHRYVYDAYSLINEGCNKYPNGAFQVLTPDGVKVIITGKLVNELKDYPDEILDIESTRDDLLLGKYTTLTGESHAIVQSIKFDLTKKLGLFIPTTIDELNYALATEFPDCEEWTAVKMHNLLLRVVALITGRILVGNSFNRKEEWLTASIDFTTDAFTGAMILRLVPPWLRVIGQYFIPQIRRVHEHHTVARKYIVPIARDRLAKMEAGIDEGHEDMIQWLLINGSDEDRADPRRIARLQLLISFAGIHTSAMGATNVMYDLAARPEYIKPLREELETVLAETNGNFTKQALTKMMKLDSFMLESQRCNPPEFTTFTRKVMKPITLSDGTFLPAGTMLQIPVGFNQHLFKSPDDFDGFRFYNLRQQSKEEANKYQFGTINEMALSFGIGRHACPGRFLAGNIIKIIVARFILDYDFKFAKEQVERPKNFRFLTTNAPDTTKEVLFKKRV